MHRSNNSTWRDLFSNLQAGLSFFVLPKRAKRKLRVTTSQFVLLVIISFLITLLGEFLITGSNSNFNPAGLPGIIVYIPFLLLVAWICSKMVGNESLILKATIAMMSIDVIATLVIYPLLLSSQFWGTQGYPILFSILVWVIYLWTIVAQIYALVSSQGIKLIEQRVVAIFVFALFLEYPMWSFQRLNQDKLWTVPYDASAYAEAQEKRERVTHEAVLYEQSSLLQSALDAIPPGRKGLPEFYTVSLGGYGKQDVFLREVTKTDKLFSERFDARGHVVLVNNPATIDTQPMATMTALKRTLKVIGERMDKDEDVLILFMTSHGASDFDFSLKLWPYSFDPLTPETLTVALDEAGIRYRAIVVSACYSGGFVEKMANQNTLIMSASRADRNSHGCSHEAEWTFFGQALFAEALNKTYSLEDAFEMARESVEKREHDEGYKASEPQIDVGEEIRPVMHAIETRLEQQQMLSSRGKVKHATTN